MNRLILLPLLMLCISCAHKNVTVVIMNNGSQDSVIYLGLPIGGRPMNITDTLIIKEGAIATVSVTLDQLATMSLINANQYTALIVEPGVELQVTLDKTANPMIQVNDSAQMRINRILKENSFYKYEFVRDYTKAPLDTVAATMLANFEALIAKDKAKFVDIEMSPEKRKFIDTQIELLWIGSLSKVIRSNYYLMVREGKPMYEGYNQLYKEIHEKYPLTTQMIPSNMFVEFANMKTLIDPIISSKEQPRPKSSEEYLKIRFENINKTITDPEIRKAAMAQMLYMDCINNNTMDVAMIKFIDMFNTAYPENPYKAVYEPFCKKIEEYHEKIKGDFSPEVKFVDNGDKVEKFEELLKQFEGKPVFIDFWFSTCGPCCDEFAHSAELKKFLKEKGIEMLYISIDRKEEDWHNAIKFFELSGNHIRANKTLHTDFYEKHGILYFPHYMLIDANGKIAIKSTKKPSEGIELQQQITEALQ